LERELAADGVSSPIRGLRNKTPEMALRIAGVLTCIEEEKEVTLQLIDRGILLAEFFLSEARRLYAASSLKPEIARALRLLRWLVERKIDVISLRDVQIRGPAVLQDAAAVKDAVRVLEEHGLCRVEATTTGGRPSRKLMLSPFAADAM
jgi:hypothetical protein